MSRMRRGVLGAVGLLAVSVSLSHAAGITTIPGAGTGLIAEATTWCFIALACAIIVGAAALGLSRFNSDFVQVFGHVLAQVGKGAFAVAAIPILALVGLTLGADRSVSVTPLGTMELVAMLLSLMVGGLIYTMPTTALMGWVIYHVRRASR